MSRGIMIFAAWCLLVTSGFAYASFAGYSPFADGQRASGARGPGGVFIGRGGPRHK
ncbi:MAG: hypothetical protein RLN87_14755 [Parasphingopyxis sp.]|uniref:hypothetical protein n=1 Tax=Parasphingopyxis sp. TaxID=1920299 RepID=UPI002603E829|nr:hypothetical protein [uncultured Parasphingopyxis sp.]